MSFVTSLTSEALQSADCPVVWNDALLEERSSSRRQMTRTSARMMPLPRVPEPVGGTSQCNHASWRCTQNCVYESGMVVDVSTILPRASNAGPNRRSVFQSGWNHAVTGAAWLHAPARLSHVVLLSGLMSV